MYEWIVLKSERIGTTFIELKMKDNCSCYRISIDGERIAENAHEDDAMFNYEVVKRNIANRDYVRTGIFED